MSNEKLETVTEASERLFPTPMSSSGYGIPYLDKREGFEAGVEWRDQNLPISDIVEFAVKYVAEHAKIKKIPGMEYTFGIDKQSILTLIPEIIEKYNEMRK